MTVFSKPVLKTPDGGGPYVPPPDREKPVNPIIDPNNPYMQLITPANSGIYWHEETGRTKELIRSEDSQEPAGESFIPGVYTDANGLAVPCGYGGGANPGRHALFSRIPSPPSGGRFTIIAMVCTQNPQDTQYDHVLSDNNLFLDGTNIGFTLNNRNIQFWTNKGGLVQQLLSPLVFNTNWWGYMGISMDVGGDGVNAYRRLDARPGQGGAVLLATATGTNVWDDTGGDATQIAGCGAVRTQSTGQYYRERLGFVYYLNVALNDTQMLDILNNPFQIFTA